MTWENILIAAIGPFLVLVGLIYQEYRKRKNAREDSDATLQAKKEPTWNDVVTENRNLRADLNKDRDEFEKRFEAQEKRIEALEMEKKLREAAARTLIYDLYGQWPPTGDGPYFDKAALDTVPDLVHPNWRWNYRTA